MLQLPSLALEEQAIAQNALFLSQSNFQTQPNREPLKHHEHEKIPLSTVYFASASELGDRAHEIVQNISNSQ